MTGRACRRWVPPGPSPEKGLSWNLGPPLFKHTLLAGPAVYGARCASLQPCHWPRAVGSLCGNAALPPRTKGPQNTAQGGGLPAFSGWGATAAKYTAE